MMVFAKAEDAALKSDLLALTAIGREGRIVPHSLAGWVRRGDVRGVHCRTRRRHRLCRLAYFPLRVTVMTSIRRRWLGRGTAR
jgi:hypothetical protein